MSQHTEGSRAERKERTRRSILDAALELAEESGLASISLRQVAGRVGVVPTAFYRHFDSVEHLGLALVEESFTSLRAMLREVRRRTTDVGSIIDTSVDVLVEHALAHRQHFRFIARERVAGPPAVRDAVRHELDLIIRELAADLRVLPGAEIWTPEDMQTLSQFIVDAMVSTTERLLSAPDSRTPAISATARRQLQMLVVGAFNWGSRTDA